MVATFDYTRTRAVADRFIGKFGQTGAIRRAGAPSGDAWNQTPGSPTDYPCVLVVVDYDERERAGTLIQAGDRKAIIAAGGLSVEPGPGDEIVVTDQPSAIVNVKPLSPGGTVILFECQIRQ